MCKVNMRCRFVDSDDTKKQQLLHEKMEKALMLRCSSIRLQKVAISDDLHKMKAKKFGDALNMDNFVFYFHL